MHVCGRLLISFVCAVLVNCDSVDNLHGTGVAATVGDGNIATPLARLTENDETGSAAEENTFLRRLRNADTPKWAADAVGISSCALIMVFVYKTCGGKGCLCRCD